MNGGLTRDHWVSRGYQQNFATESDKRVAILDVHLGKVVDRARPIKSNFREQGFTTFLQAGVANSLLERAFASVERRVLNEIRNIDSTRRGAQQKADVANLFAIHLVRSPSFKASHSHITERFRGRDVTAMADDDELRARFIESAGRSPEPEELLELVHRVYDDIVSDPLHLVTSMIRQHDQMADKLNDYHLQVVELGPQLPGFAVGDTPIVHCSRATNRFGFRDHLALGDADVIIGPLTRRTAACFSARPLPPVRITTRKRADAINAMFLRAANREVACHPDDAKALRQAFDRIDRLPPSLLFGP